MPDAITWREKAATLRAAAEHAADQVTQQSLLLLAQDCDTFAEEEDATADRGVRGPRAPRSDEADR